MSSGPTGRGSAIDAYDAMASIYDEFNAANDYEKWLGEVLLPELERQGLRQMTGRVLDVGCGTGRALPPLERRGWSVTGCDSSKAMLQQALKNYGPHRWASLGVADARNVPDFDHPFDLIIALNDVINYLTEDGDLELFFGGVKRNLAPHGLVCFDANSLSVYEQDWLAGMGENMRQRGWDWTGRSAEAAPGKAFEAEVGGPGIESSVHRQRHWQRGSIEYALNSAGLECLAVVGQRGEGDELALDEVPSEELHYKLIYIAGHPDEG